CRRRRCLRIFRRSPAEVKHMVERGRYLRTEIEAPRAPRSAKNSRNGTFPLSWRSLALLALQFFLLTDLARAQQSSDLSTQARNVFAQRCYECHSSGR